MSAGNGSSLARRRRPAEVRPLADDGRPVIVTEEQRERFNRARNRGDVCGACGHGFAMDEPVYHQLIRTATAGPRAPQAPVCRGCASPALLREVDGCDPEPCAGCGRPNFYRRKHDARRQRAACSRNCKALAARKERAGKERQAGG